MDPVLDLKAKILQDCRSLFGILFWLSFFDIPRHPFGTPLGDRGAIWDPQGAPKGPKAPPKAPRPPKQPSTAKTP